MEWKIPELVDRLLSYAADKWKVDSVEELLKTCKTNIRTFNE